MSASGHVNAGESPLQSLLREVKEELGLDIHHSEFRLLGKFWRHKIYREDFIENELDYIYVVIKDIQLEQITIQKEEVEAVAWFDVVSFKNMLKEGKVVNRKYVWDALFTYTDSEVIE